MKKVKEAAGGVLFMDEAYQQAAGKDASNNDYGGEAIERCPKGNACQNTDPKGTFLPEPGTGPLLGLEVLY